MREMQGYLTESLQSEYENIKQIDNLIADLVRSKDRCIENIKTINKIKNALASGNSAKAITYKTIDNITGKDGFVKDMEVR